MGTVNDYFDRRARASLGALFPSVGPWALAALWHGLDGVPPPPSTPLEAELDAIIAQRLSGLTLRYLRDTGVAVDPATRQELQRATFTWMSITVQAKKDGVAAIDALRESGIAAVVSKGPGVAELYPSPDCRPYSDLDLVVDRQDFRRGVQVLEGLGWFEEERNIQPWRFFRWACREGVNLSVGELSSVDLHHRFPPWIWAERIRLDDIRRRARSSDGVAADFLSPVDNLLVVALHLISDRNAPGRTLLIWRDLIQLARSVSPPQAAEVAAAAGLAGWLKAVLGAIPVEFRPVELHGSLPDDPIPHALRLQLLLSNRTRRMGVVASQFLRLPLPSGLAFVVGMLVPSRSFLRLKFPDVRRPFLQWWRVGAHVRDGAGEPD